MINPFQNIGTTILRYEAVGSTNDVARELLQSDALPDGVVIAAAYQHKGRGQQETRWESEPGKNLLLTYVVHHHGSELQRQVIFNMAVANAIHQWVVQQGIENCYIKWPNDIYVHSKKLSGILIENVLNGTAWKASLVGIGINVNQKHFEHVQAISLAQATGKEFDLSACLQSLSLELRKQLKLFFLKQDKAIRDYYLKHLYRKGQLAYYQVEGKQIKGVIQGVDEAGRLLVQINGATQAFANKSIAYIHT